VNSHHEVDINPLGVSIFGRTGPEVTMVGLGGERILRWKRRLLSIGLVKGA